MASNPMQRQKRVSFLLGFLTMLALAAVVIGILGFSIYKMKEEEKEREAKIRKVCVVSSEIESGGVIENVTIKDVPGDAVPTNALTTVPSDSIAKISLGAGTILTEEMITNKEETLTNDLRVQEYNIATLPTEIQTGDYIDVRIRFPSGLDYIVVSKKKITIPEIAGVPSSDTFTLNMSEAETNVMSCAIVEAYKLPGTEIYVNKFVEPGMQQASVGSYIPSDQVNRLISGSPNIIAEAKNEFYKRYYLANSEEQNNIRSNIQSELDQVDGDEAKENVESGIQEHITRQKQYKQEYLQALSGV